MTATATMTKIIPMTVGHGAAVSVPETEAAVAMAGAGAAVAAAVAVAMVKADNNHQKAAVGAAKTVVAAATRAEVALEAARMKWCQPQWQWARDARQDERGFKFKLLFEVPHIPIFSICIHENSICVSGEVPIIGGYIEFYLRLR
jgi:hypothetical protein